MGEMIGTYTLFKLDFLLAFFSYVLSKKTVTNKNFKNIGTTISRCLPPVGFVVNQHVEWEITEGDFLVTLENVDS